MKFILLSDNYYPYGGSGSIIVGDLVNEFISHGHEVMIITFVDSQEKKSILSENGNITIVRIRIRARKYGNIGRLFAESRYSKEIINYLSNCHNIECDGVICYAPSIFFGKAVNWLKKRFEIKSYLIVRDIFPKWALEAGLLKDGLVYKYLKFIESQLYNSSNIIGIESKSDLNYFRNYGINDSIKIEVLNNWGAELPLTSLNDYNHFLDPKKINIVYGGNMGTAQDLLSLIDLIDISIFDKKVFIYLIGDGNQYQSIEKNIKRKNISNIVIMPSIPREEFLTIMKDADIGLVSLNEKLISNNYPLKMIGYMQLSIPILASVNPGNEIINLINDNNIGYASIAKDKLSFNKNLLKMISNQSNLKIQGKNAKKLFNEKFTVKVAQNQVTSHFFNN